MLCPTNITEQYGLGDTLFENPEAKIEYAEDNIAPLEL